MKYPSLDNPHRYLSLAPPAHFPSISSIIPSICSPTIGFQSPSLNHSIGFRAAVLFSRTSESLFLAIAFSPSVVQNDPAVAFAAAIHRSLCLSFSGMSSGPLPE